MKITDIISRYLSHKESHEEKSQFTQWYDDSSKNIEIIKELDSLWEVSEQMSDYKSFDTNHAWHQLDNKLETNARKPIISTRLLLGSCVILLAGLLIWNVTDKTSNSYKNKQEQEFKTTDSTLSYALVDDSRFWLNTNSELSKNSDFSSDRNVTLNGQGYFEITRDRKRPFVIDTGLEKVTVLGTTFDLNTYGETFDLKVSEGLVSVDTKKRLIEVGANQRLVKDNGMYTLIDWHETSKAHWRYQNLSFVHARLSDVIATISQTFDIVFELEDGMDLTNCMINTKFSDESFSDILAELEVIVNLKVDQVSSKSYKITHLHCQ